MFNQYHAINDKAVSSDFLYSLFNNYSKGTESKVTLNFTLFDINPIIRDILNYVKISSEYTNVPEFKDILVVSNNIFDPDVKVISANKILKDFEPLLDKDKALTPKALGDIYDNYSSKVVIVNTSLFTVDQCTDLSEIAECLSVVSNMVIEINVIDYDENPSSYDILLSKLFDDPKSQDDLMDWITRYNDNSISMKRRYRDYANKYTKVYSFKYFKTVVKRYNNDGDNSPVELIDTDLDSTFPPKDEFLLNRLRDICINGYDK